MARRARRYSSRRTYRSAVGRRRTTRRYSRSAPRRRSSGRSQTVRVVIEQAPAGLGRGAGMHPVTGNLMAPAAIKKATF